MRLAKCIVKSTWRPYFGRLRAIHAFWLANASREAQHEVSKMYGIWYLSPMWSTQRQLKMKMGAENEGIRFMT